MRMRTLTALAAVAMSAGALLAAALPAAAGTGSRAGNRYLQTNLVSDRTDQGAQIVDKNLLNPWGLAFGPATPLWVADNNAGRATVYRIRPGGTSVTKVPLTVSLKGGGRASTGDGPSPTGQVFNPTRGFVVRSAAGHSPAVLIFDSESGRISAWSPAADPISAGTSTGQVEFRSKTAVFKGLALAAAGGHTFLYATNFHSGRVNVFDSRFRRVPMPGAFRDPALPAHYAPFGIRAIGGLLYVTYARQNAQRHDDVSGPGHGFIDVFTTRGALVRRLASRGALNSPWGLAMAPGGFGRFSHMLLVGNFGNGRINAFNPKTGRLAGQLHDPHGTPISIDDLWALTFGTTTTGGTRTLLFSAGINDEKDGLVGSINTIHAK
jgi:uncharacterized protein (TIGR03118 family)